MKSCRKWMIACAISLAWVSSDYRQVTLMLKQIRNYPSRPRSTKSVTAIGYEVGGGSTKVDLKATELMPEASGWAKVEIKAKAGRSSIEVQMKGLKPPSVLGAEFPDIRALGGHPEGRTGNTGEILLNKNGEGKLTATTPAQTFSLLVTAEPYFRHPPAQRNGGPAKRTPKRHQGQSLPRE